MMRLYRALLHVCPASFRAEYGEEMCRVFARRRRDAAGTLGVIALGLDAIADLMTTGVAVHWDVLRQDLRYTVRSLRKSLGFTVTAILVVAIGIGANTAAFSVADIVLLRPLPFPHADRLVKIWERTPGYGRMELSPANYRDWKRMARSFDNMGAFYGTSVNLLGNGEPERLVGSAVTADLLPTLGVRSLIGRLFTAEDDAAGAAGTIILTYGFWQTKFGGDPGVLGRSLMLDARPFTVIGVMPREFNFPTPGDSFWVTTRFGEQNYVDRTDNWLQVVGRLKPGVALAQAQAEMDVISAQLERQFPKENEKTGAAIFELQSEVSNQSRLLLFALVGAALCVLLIACANLANLLLARALARRQELAVRTAMGAGRERLVRQLMTESGALALAGGTLGVLVAMATVPLLAQLVPPTLPLAHAPSIDLRVLAFAAVLTALTAVAFGLVPVVRAGGRAGVRGLNEGVRSGGGGKERLRSALVVVEIVASIVLLISSGLLVRALWRLQGPTPVSRATASRRCARPSRCQSTGRPCGARSSTHEC